MQTPHYVEDWLLLLNGQLDSQLKIMPGHHSTGPVHLTHSDANFVESVCRSILSDQGLTNKQIFVARRILSRYRLQFAAAGFDNLNVEIAPNRLPVRVINYTNSVEYDADQQLYRLQFQYRPELVNFLHEQSINSIGEFQWRNDQKQWTVYATECNLMILVQFMLHAKNNLQWQFSPEAQEHFDAVADVISNPASHMPHIELCHGGLELRNATAALRDAVLKDGFESSGDALLWAMRAHKYAIQSGPALQQHLRERYPTVADAVLIDKTQTLKDQSKYHGVSLGIIFEIMRLLPNLHWIFVVDLQHFDKNAMFFRFVEGLGISNQVKIFSIENWQSVDIATMDLSETIAVTNVSNMVHHNHQPWNYLSKHCMKYFFHFGGE